MLVFMKYLFLPKLLALVVTAQSEDSDTLKSVQILFRHGARESDTVAGQPTGLLTPNGKKQMYDLGVFFRQRYNGLIKNVYDEHEISILSSDFDRTIQSASLVAYGLYKDFNMAANWNGDEEERVQFEPIPVRTLHKKYDKYIQMTSNCPRRTELESGVLVSYYSRFLEENVELVNYYAQHSDDQIILDSNQGSRERINGLLLTQQQAVMNQTNNLPIIDWVQPLMKNSAFLSIETGGMYEIVNTVEKQLFHTGPIIKLFIENMEEPDSTRKKIHLFSGHDRTITVLLFTLNIFDPLVYTMPPTGSSLIIELHENHRTADTSNKSTSKQFLQIWLRNDTQNDPYLLEIPNCGKPCYLSTFKELTKEIVPVDFEGACTIPSAIFSIVNVTVEVPATSSQNQVNVFLIFSMLTLSLLIIIGIFQIMRMGRKCRSHEYGKL